MAEYHQKKLPWSSSVHDYGTFGASDKKQFEAAVSEGKLVDALSTILTKSVADFPFHIAVVGEPGSGKSSFINSIHNPHLDGSSGAATNIVAKAENSDHINAEFHEVSFSEITWKGELLRAEDTHGKEVDLNAFHFFIIVASQGCQPIPSHLVQKVQQMDKEFSLIQSKADLHVEGAKKEQPSDHGEEKIVLPTKDFCRESLRNKGVKDPQVFAVSSKEPNRFDFPHLRDTLKSDLLRKKEKAFLCNITTVSSSVLEVKVDKLKGKTWFLIIFSGFIAVIPVPGAAFLGGIVIFIVFASWCRRNFGVDDKSLSKLAEFIQGLLSDLKSVMTSQSKRRVILQRLPDFLGSSVMSAEYLYWNRFPIIGCILSVGISFISSFFTLKKVPSNVKTDTQNIISKAAAIKLKKTNPENQ